MMTQDAKQAINILMIDDDEDDYVIVRDIIEEIERVNYKLDWKSSYQDGMKALLAHPYDICLLDYQLGALTGLDFLQELNCYECNIPVIMLTGQNDREIDLSAMNTGAADYLIKNQVSTAIVERSIRYAIAHAKALEEIKIRERIIEHRTEQLQRANEELKRLAQLDGLTGIANRRCFDQAFESEWARASRAKEPLSLILIDIDFFKSYNDQFGHLKGDECLKWVAHHISRSIQRPADLLARYGGEEFVVLLPGTELPGAIQLANQIRHSIEALELQASDTRVSPWVTLSAGVATCLPTAEKKPEQLIHEADQALYQAKRQGRNRVYSNTE